MNVMELHEYLSQFVNDNFEWNKENADIIVEILTQLVQYTKDLNASIEDQQMQIEYLEKRCSSLIQLNTENQGTYEQLEREIFDLTQTKTKLEYENRQFNKTITRLKTTIHFLNEDCDNFCTELQIVNGELKNLQYQENNDEVFESQEILRSIQLSVEQNEKENAILKQANADLEQRIFNLLDSSTGEICDDKSVQTNISSIKNYGSRIKGVSTEVEQDEVDNLIDQFKNYNITKICDNRKELAMKILTENIDKQIQVDFDTYNHQLSLYELLREPEETDTESRKDDNVSITPIHYIKNFDKFVQTEGVFLCDIREHPDICLSIFNEEPRSATFKNTTKKNALRKIFEILKNIFTRKRNKHSHLSIERSSQINDELEETEDISFAKECSSQMTSFQISTPLSKSKCVEVKKSRRLSMDFKTFCGQRKI